MTDLFIFDIDGVLADCTHRLKYRDQKDYKSFYNDENIKKDEPIYSGLALLDNLVKGRCAMIVFITGRSQSTKKATENWLWHQGLIPYVGRNDSGVRYRSDGDYRPSPVVKVEMVGDVLKELYVEPEVFSDGDYNEGYYNFRHAYFIDDDPENVKAVEEAYPSITGIIFSTKRLKDNEE